MCIYRSDMYSGIPLPLHIRSRGAAMCRFLAIHALPYISGYRFGGMDLLCILVFGCGQLYRCTYTLLRTPLLDTDGMAHLVPLLAHISRLSVGTDHTLLVYATLVCVSS